MTDLFSSTHFRSHSGVDLRWKIDADALTDADLATLAEIVAEQMTFHHVIGIPRGGLRFATALKPYAITRVQPGPNHPILLVDDVLTTGASMEEARRDIVDPYVVGVVIFARRTPGLTWIKPIFTLSDWMGGRPREDRTMIRGIGL